MVLLVLLRYGWRPCKETSVVTPASAAAALAAAPNAVALAAAALAAAPNAVALTVRRKST